MLQDVRHALRLLGRSPGFGFVAFLTLTLGIGVAATNFLLCDGFLFRPLPFVRDGDRLVAVEAYLERDKDGHMGLALPDFRDLHGRLGAIQGLTISQPRTFIFSGPGVERVLGSWVSSWGFDTLGVAPVLGRTFRPADDAPDAPPVAILGHALWTRRFEGDTGILGRRVTINGKPVEIVGIMPAGFAFPMESELWMPFEHQSTDYPRGSFDFEVVGRLGPSASLADANAELADLGLALAGEHPVTNRGIAFRALPLREANLREARTVIHLMLGAAGFILLIACANVANLLLSRAASRGREIAIRAALGATRGRIVRQVLTECLVLAAAGGIGGTLLSLWGLDAVLSLTPEDRPYWMQFPVDHRLFLFAGAATLACALLSGFLPALHLSRQPLAADLREGGRGTTSSRRTSTARNALIVGQVSLALILLIGAGLTLRSFFRLRDQPLGIDPSGILTFRVGLPPTQFEDKAYVGAFFRQLARETADISGVEAATVLSYLPATTNRAVMAFLIEGRPEPEFVSEAPHAQVLEVSPGFLETYRIPLLRGRDLSADDTEVAVLVDTRFAETFFPDEEVLGKRITYGDKTKGGPARPWFRIVGVIPPVTLGLREDGGLPGVYSNLLQGEIHFANVALRVATGDPAAYAAAAQQAVDRVEPGIPIYNVGTQADWTAFASWDQRFMAVVFSFFGLVSLFLSALGIYGVVAHNVAHRTQEIGVRIALGANPRQVLRMVSLQGVRLVLAGLAIGLAGALLLTRSMAALLYQVDPTDPPTYFAFSLILAFVGFLACWLPARRATRIDPLIALRGE